MQASREQVYYRTGSFHNALLLVTNLHVQLNKENICAKTSKHYLVKSLSAGVHTSVYFTNYVYRVHTYLYTHTHYVCKNGLIITIIHFN